MQLPVADAFFVTDDGKHFVATSHSRGPWSADACHGGPPTALMVRAAELLDPDKQFARITNDIIRPIPTTGFTVEAEIIRKGRAVTTVEVRITADNKIMAKASAILLREAAHEGDIKGLNMDGPRLEDAPPGRFPVKGFPEGLPAFNNAVDVRYPEGSSDEATGGASMWMRTLVPILEHEEPSGFQRISPLADCANGLAPNQPFSEFAALNPDLTLTFHREPRGEWFLMDAVTHAHPNGIGSTESRLFDVEGPVGATSQTILINPMR